MTDKSAFTDDEWKALTQAPLLISLAMVAVGQHGPISMVKEAAATARTLTQPGDRGAADELVAAIAKEAEGHEARHDASQHRGKSFEDTVDEALTELQGAASALAKLPADESGPVAAWFVDIARAVADAAKGTSEQETATIGRIAAVFGVATG
jgi:hypothetical protein